MTTDHVARAIQTLVRDEPELADSADYFSKNLKIWTHFKKYADRAARDRRKRYSAGHIFSLIRWDTPIRATDKLTRIRGGDEVRLKIGDRHSHFYALLWEYLNPAHAGWFRVARETEGQIAAVERARRNREAA